MKRKWIFFLTLAVSTSALSQVMDGSLYFFDWKQGVSKSKKQQTLRMLRGFGIDVDESTWKMRLTKSQKSKVARLKTFEYLERDRLNNIEKPNIFIKQKAQFGGIWSKEWHLEKVDVGGAWRVTKGSRDIKVAVCDSGVLSTHRELAGKVLKGWNFIDDDDDTSPNTNHGTAVSGFIAASEVNSFGTHGIAPGISILPGKIVTKTGHVPTSAMLKCIRWAADEGARVINVSMTGVNRGSSASAARYANKRGALVVWAAGNQNYYSRRWKGRSEIVAVAGTDIGNQRYFAKVIRSNGSIRYYGSNRGPFVDIAAPGEDIFTMRVDESFSRSNGTSYSAPIVSGIAALIFSVNPKLTPKKVTSILKKSATKMNRRWSFGSGLVNAKKAVELAQKTL